MCSHSELTKDHVLTGAYVNFFRTVTRNAVYEGVWRKKNCSWPPLNKYAMNVWLSSLRIRAHLSWRTGKHLHVFHVLRTYSTCSYPGYQDTTTYAALPSGLNVISFVVLLFYQLVLSSTLTLPNSTFGYIHTVFVWWAPFSHSYTIWTKRKHLTRNSFSDAFFRLAYSHTFWNPLIYYSMNAKVRKYPKEDIMNKSKAQRK